MVFCSQAFCYFNMPLVSLSLSLSLPLFPLSDSPVEPQSSSGRPQILGNRRKLQKPLKIEKQYRELRYADVFKTKSTTLGEIANVQKMYKFSSNPDHQAPYYNNS